MGQALSTWTIVIIGMALFSAHFGVGDVIFPTMLGKETGLVWLLAGLGYFAINTVITFIGYLAVAKDRVGVVHMSTPVMGPFFAKIFGSILMLVLGPVFILPRVASATHEMSIIPFFPSAPIAITLAIFFALNAYVCLGRSTIVDRLGKVLSPALIIFIALVALKGILGPISSPVDTGVTVGAAFGKGFNYGYNTMNAIAAVLMGAWILNDLYRRGVQEPSDQTRTLMKVGLITVALLGTTQLVQTWLGASTGAVYKDATLGVLPVKITTHLWGTMGLGIFAVLLGLACFTTSAGATASAGYFFEQMTGGKLPYSFTVVVSSIVGFLLGLVGLDRIVAYTVPWLNLLYPSLIVIILGSYFTDATKTRYILAGGVIVALVFGFFDAVGVAGIDVPWMKAILAAMPLGDVGFPWLVPTIIGLVIGYLFQLTLGKKEATPRLQS